MVNLRRFGGSALRIKNMGLMDSDHGNTDEGDRVFIPLRPGERAQVDEGHFVHLILVY